METLQFKRAPSDVNGNPRYVVHFRNLLTVAEKDRMAEVGNIQESYAIACARANTIGGRKYNNKRFGGGIVFQSYSVHETASHISRITGRLFSAIKD